jgi:carbon storage regulator
MDATTLTLTRRPGEKIQIGEDVTIEVATVRGNRTRLRITAPADRRIRRSELEPFTTEPCPACGQRLCRCD